MKLAFTVPNLGSSQLVYQIIRQANFLVGTRSDADIMLLFETLAKPCLPMNFAAMHISEGWGYDGTVVATTLNTASKLLQFPSPVKRIFYCWDLEYLRQPRPFRETRNIYCHPDLSLFARSQDHADALSNAWNRPVTVMPEERMVVEFSKMTT